MSSNRGHRAGQCATEVPRTGIRARGDLQELRHGEPAALFATKHLRPWLAGALHAVRQHREAGAGRQEAASYSSVSARALCLRARCGTELWQS